VDVEGLLANQRQAFEGAWQRLQTHSPWAAWRASRTLAESARRARLRERARSAYVRDRWAIRLFALRAAELTGLGEKVFFLTLDELLSFLTGDERAIEAVDARATLYKQYRALPAYPPIIRGPFEPFAWAADPDRAGDIFAAGQRIALSARPEQLVGSPGSAGTVEGPVRIVDRPEHGDVLQPGEIMVAVQTDVAWTLLFPRAAAVITDIGAPLSHAAIVARELGIPAVVGCGNATAALNTGDRVRVDGGRGTVEILSRAD
jgi:pyruvate,water dikinase